MSGGGGVCRLFEGDSLTGEVIGASTGAAIAPWSMTASVLRDGEIHSDERGNVCTGFVQGLGEVCASLGVWTERVETR